MDPCFTCTTKLLGVNQCEEFYLGSNDVPRFQNRVLCHMIFY